MTETTKRNQNTSSKSRKSRNEIIRSALGLYLKQKNYTATEKYRKSDLALTHTNKQLQYNMLLDDDISKTNSFLYSNGLCLGNNPQLVDQQYTKFLQFVKSQNDLVKSELDHLLQPLLCHLYIELLKGKASQPATEFLKKYAHLIGPIEHLDNPVAHKINGSPVAATMNDEQFTYTPSASTQILFVHESSTDDGESTRQGYFKHLIQLISTCMRIEELDSMEETRNFRYSKYEMEISLQTLHMLKQFLVKNGHVILLHVLQTWFSFEITDVDGLFSDHENDDTQEKTIINSESDNRTTTIADELFTKLKKETKIDSHKKIRNLLTEKRKRVEFKIPAAVKNVDGKSKESTATGKKKRVNMKLRNLRKSVVKMKTHDKPIRIFKVNNSDNKLTCADIDTDECHLVCGFSDSTIRLWQLNRSTIGRRKPYATFSSRSCDWNLMNENSDYSSDNDDDDYINNKQNNKIHSKNYINLPANNLEESQIKNEESTNENTFCSSEGVSLCGHSRGVTDILFSKHYPLLFSVSKDLTMRAWKSSDYRCGAVYRGHTYPIWCMAESPLGTYLATGSKDYTARLWCTDRQHPLQTYIAHTQDVDAIAFHPNGNYIATGSTDLTVRLWCVTSGKLFRVFTDCHLPIKCVNFSPDGKYLAAAGEETKIRIFDLAAGSQIMELKDHTSAVANLAWNSSSSTLASCCADGSIRIFNVVKNTTDPVNTSASSTSTTIVTPASTTLSSLSSSNKLLISYFSDCKKSFKIYFNSNYAITSIGSN